VDCLGDLDGVRHCLSWAVWAVCAQLSGSSCLSCLCIMHRINFTASLSALCVMGGVRHCLSWAVWAVCASLHQYHCVTAPLHQWSLHHCITASVSLHQYHCVSITASVHQYHCVGITASVHCASITASVSLHHCISTTASVSLHHCITASLHHCLCCLCEGWMGCMAVWAVVSHFLLAEPFLFRWPSSHFVFRWHAQYNGAHQQCPPLSPSPLPLTCYWLKTSRTWEMLLTVDRQMNKLCARMHVCICKCLYVYLWVCVCASLVLSSLVHAHNLPTGVRICEGLGAMEIVLWAAAA